MDTALANFAPIHTKLNSPHYLQEAMPRPRLTHLSQEIENLKLLSIIAAPGFGKSTLLVQLQKRLASTNIQLAWLNLDDDDNDPITMTEYLCAAFYQLDNKIGKRSLSILKSGSLRSLKELYAALIEDIYQSQNRFMLFVDDFHFLKKGESLQLWQWFIDHLPEQLTLVIASRKALPLSLKRLQLNRQYYSLNSEELLFTFSEAQDFFLNYHKQPVSETLLQNVYEKTEGWIGALQMLFLSMKQVSRPQELFKNFSGEHKDIMEYLSEVVLQQISADLKNFMLSISILDRFCAPLAERLSGQTNAQDQLEEIEKRQFFLIPLDHEKRWYRFHHLFQEFLRRQALKMFGEAALQEKYREASLWFKEEAYDHEAIQYALTGKDYTKAAELISQFAMQLVQNQGDHRTLQHWMKQLPEEYLAAFPMIRLSYAFSLTFTNKYRNAKAELSKLRSYLNNETPPELAMMLLSSIEMNECFIDLLQDKLLLARQRAEAWLKKWPQIEGVPRGLILDARGGSHVFSSFFKQGYEDLRQAEEIHKANKMYYAYMWALGGQFGILWSHGKLSKALEVYERIRSEIPKYFSSDPGHQKLMQIGVAETYYEKGDFEQATLLQKDNRIYLYSFSSTDPNIAFYLVPIRIHLLREDFTRADEVLNEGEKSAKELEYPRFQDQMFLLKIELYLHTKRSQEAKRLLESRSWSNPTELVDEIEDTNAMIENIFARLALVRVLMAEKKFSEASSRLKTLTALLEKIGLMRHLLSAKIMEVLCDENRKLQDQALQRLRETLELAAPEGFVAVFLEQGATLNHQLYALLKQVDVFNTEALKLRNRILRELEKYFEQGKKAHAHGLQLLDKISTRELEILSALESAKDNTQVAKSLHISLGTLKWHLHNIYQKLDVKNRNGAILKAKQLELI